MKLIADSGSTKTDWRLIKETGEILEVKTQGLNPFFKSVIDCERTFENDLLPRLEGVAADNIQQLWFYGAGCSSDDKCAVIKTAATNVFPEASISVDHDLLGAARALCGDEPGIAGILGTGSNSCYYDGSRVVKNVTALGYILGDEGSGAHIGKNLIKDYLDFEVPESMRQRFDSKFGLGKDQLLHEVYSGDLPNRFLASFAKWVFQIRGEEEYAYKLIESCLTSFLNKHVCKYEQHQQVPLNIVGSVGYHGSDILRSLCKSKGITLGKVIQSPIQALTEYHSNESEASI